MEWMLLPYRRLYRLIEGRSSRREYWMFALLNILIALAVVAVFAATVGMASLDQGDLSGAFLGATFGLMILLVIPLYVWAALSGIAGVAVTIRRFHDLNLTGWLYVGVLVLSFVPVVNFVVWLGVLVLMCLKGTDGPNKYGADPTQPETASVFE